MRRPVCLFALLFTAAVWAAVLLSPPQPSISEKAEGRYVTLRGTVEEKEYAVQDPGGEQYIRLSLKDAVLESEVPQEGAFEIRRGDKILCTIEDDPEMQREWAREGACVQIRGRIRLFKRPSNDGEFDSFMYYSVIKGYLFTLADAHILAYNSEKDPVRSALDNLRNRLSDVLDRICSENTGITAVSAPLFSRRCCWERAALSSGRSGRGTRQQGSSM